MTTPTLFNEIEFDEGLRLKPYKDKMGIWSIGIGHNLQADPNLNSHLKDLLKTGISEQVARQIFANDVQRAENDLDLHIPWWRTLDDVRQNVFVNVCFNIGCGKLLTFHHTLDAAKAHQYAAAGKFLGETTPWANQVPERAHRLSLQLATGVSQYN